MVGFEHEADAQQFWADLRQRLAKFALELADDKTRLVEFGRFAATRRRRRGLGRPETFVFLGLVHYCTVTRQGRFRVGRATDRKRMRAKLRALKDELKRRRHLPISEQGRWLASVLRGHMAYYAVPGNSRAINAFRYALIRHWRRSLARRSQRGHVTWERMNRLANLWLPQVRIAHPWPAQRFDAKTQGRSPVR